ncbi:unnamed protein product [Orchesella dallaii]|uniref:Uncharacterized protein n=1 Tax=Orchesella dallaii TaxID=48710 RepID=A0ABP1PU18_9HEXA
MGLIDFWNTIPDLESNGMSIDASKISDNLISTRPKFTVMIVNEVEPKVSPSHLPLKERRATSNQSSIRKELIQNEKNTRLIEKVLLHSKDFNPKTQCTIFKTVGIKWKTLNWNELRMIARSQSVTEFTSWKIVGQQSFSHFLKESKYLGNLRGSETSYLLGMHPQYPNNSFSTDGFSDVNCDCKFDDGHLLKLLSLDGGSNQIIRYKFYSLNFRFVACEKLPTGFLSPERDYPLRN